MGPAVSLFLDVICSCCAWRGAVVAKAAPVTAAALCEVCAGQEQAARAGVVGFRARAARWMRGGR